MAFNGLETKALDSIVLGHDAAIMRTGGSDHPWRQCLSQKKGILGCTDAKTLTVADENF